MGFFFKRAEYSNVSELFPPFSLSSLGSVNKVRDKKALSAVNCDLKIEGADVDGCWQHVINVISVLELFQD